MPSFLESLVSGASTGVDTLNRTLPAAMASYRQQQTWDMQRQEHEYKKQQNNLLVDALAEAAEKKIIDPLKAYQLFASKGITSPQHLMMGRKFLTKSFDEVKSAIAQQYINAPDPAAKTRILETLQRLQGKRPAWEVQQIDEAKKAATAKYRRGSTGSAKPDFRPWSAERQRLQAIVNRLGRRLAEARSWASNPTATPAQRTFAANQATKIQTSYDAANSNLVRHIQAGPRGNWRVNSPVTAPPPAKTEPEISGANAPQATPPPATSAPQGRSRPVTPSGQRMVPGKVYIRGNEKITLKKVNGEWVIIRIPK